MWFARLIVEHLVQAVVLQGWWGDSCHCCTGNLHHLDPSVTLLLHNCCAGGEIRRPLRCHVPDFVVSSQCGDRVSLDRDISCRRTRVFLPIT